MSHWKFILKDKTVSGNTDETYINYADMFILKN